jgi:hypothetical protein
VRRETKVLLWHVKWSFRFYFSFGAQSLRSNSYFATQFSSKWEVNWRIELKSKKMTIFFGVLLVN